MTETRGRRLDDATNAAESCHVLTPALEKRRHGQGSLFRQILGEDQLDLLDHVDSGLSLLAFERLQGLDAVDVEACMAAATELVVNLEDPRGNVEVLGNQLRQRVKELLLVVDIDLADRRRDVRELEDLLGAGLG